MKRVVCNVATGAHYLKGQARLSEMMRARGESVLINCDGQLPEGYPSHESIPYGFKSYALKGAADAGADTLLWCDACIIPNGPLDALWEKIETEGAWISANGWANAEWTADSAYPDLFQNLYNAYSGAREIDGVKRSFQQKPGFFEAARAENWGIRHVVATAFGISLNHPVGVNILREYYRLASETKAFCGPWTNAAHPDAAGKPVDGVRVAACGPADVRGHRHDQVVLSVLAHRLNVKLTQPPNIFAYAGSETKDTTLVASGNY